jgi:hypothetical protein
MTTPPGDIEMRLRHLDMIQAVVTRQAQNSFAVRGWSVTVVSAVFAIAATQEDAPAATVLVALAPTLIFWGLDAYYLWQERLFRSLYAAAARRAREGADADPDVPLFDMSTVAYRAQAGPYWRALVQPGVAAIPAMLGLVVLVFWLWVN